MIAILGASGTVGTAAVDWLRRLELGPLRLGARRPEALAGRGEQMVAADATGAESLAAFCKGARVVLNCAGPSYRMLDRVAESAIAAGADYVDLAGDGPAHRLLAARDPAARGSTVVLSAGVLPGLSGLLPRWLAGQARGRPVGLVVHAGGLERCTPAAAADLLLSLPSANSSIDHGESLAAWRDGIRRSGVLRAGPAQGLDYFPGTPYRQPFLTAEADRLAAHLGLSELDWYHVYPGERVQAVLAAAVGTDLSDFDQFAAMATRLRTAAEVDLAGRRAYYRLAFRLRAHEQQHELVVELADSYRATGWMGAWTVRAVLNGEIPPGLHFAAEVLDPKATVAALNDSGLVNETEDGAL
ncbi:saccharopine dehydrogenase NADP-binding domain-containing protein [Streptomyces sp. NPDC054933]